MKRLLFTNWHLMRWAFIAFGLFFFIQVIFNLGCGPNGCAIPNNKYAKR
jgi:hypothetical protein